MQIVTSKDESAETNSRLYSPTKLSPKEIANTFQEQAEDGVTTPSYHANNAGDIFEGLTFPATKWSGDLRGATFIRCDLRGADFTQANVEGATFILCSLACSTLPKNVRLQCCETEELFRLPNQHKDKRDNIIALTVSACVVSAGILNKDAHLIRTVAEGAAGGALIALLLLVITYLFPGRH